MFDLVKSGNKVMLERRLDRLFGTAIFLERGEVIGRK